MRKFRHETFVYISKAKEVETVIVDTYTTQIEDAINEYLENVILDK